MKASKMGEVNVKLSLWIAKGSFPYKGMRSKERHENGEEKQGQLFLLFGEERKRISEQKPR